MSNNKINSMVFDDPKYWREVHERASCFAKNILNPSWQKPLMQIAHAAFEVEMLVRNCVCDCPQEDSDNSIDQWKEQN